MKFKYQVSDIVTPKRFTKMAFSHTEGYISIKSGEPMQIINRLSTGNNTVYEVKLPQVTTKYKENRTFRFLEKDLLPYIEPIG